MAKIVNSASGPIPPGPLDLAPRAIDGRKELLVTPNPKTKAQRQANTKAQRLIAATKRQEENAYVPAKLSKWQKKARRKRERELRYKVMQADLASGKITPEEAKARLPKRQEGHKKDIQYSGSGPSPVSCSDQLILSWENQAGMQIQTQG
jgi:hypothetical protein